MGGRQPSDSGALGSFITNSHPRLLTQRRHEQGLAAYTKHQFTSFDTNNALGLGSFGAVGGFTQGFAALGGGLIQTFYMNSFCNDMCQHRWVVMSVARRGAGWTEVKRIEDYLWLGLLTPLTVPSPPHSIVATSLTATTIVNMVAASIYVRQGLVCKRSVALVGGVGGIALVGSSYLALKVPEREMKTAFAGFLVFSSAMMIRKGWSAVRRLWR